MQLVTVDVTGVESPGVEGDTCCVPAVCAACVSRINSSAEACCAPQPIAAATTIRIIMLRMISSARFCLIVSNIGIDEALSSTVVDAPLVRARRKRRMTETGSDFLGRLQPCR
jgi:hypothetical protein